MDESWILLLLILSPVFIEAWKSSQEERWHNQDVRGDKVIHYHSKRHMLPPEKRQPQPIRNIQRKKPSGHLAPLQEEDIDNDEVVSVAIGPPPIRPKYDKMNYKPPPKNISGTSSVPEMAVDLIKNVLSELGREFLTKQVNEDFVFGQYVGNSMTNLTSELRLKMQHEILEVIVKYQKMNRNNMLEPTKQEDKPITTMKQIQYDKKMNPLLNDTDEAWPDFSNLAKIVG